MDAPISISTMDEAAAWYAAQTGQNCDARQLLDLVFKHQLRARLQTFEADSQESEWPYLSLWVALPLGARLVFRRWTPEKETTRAPDAGQLIPFPPDMDDIDAMRHILEGGGCAVTFPRTADPWPGEDGLCIDAADTRHIVTLDMLRIYARDLVGLYWLKASQEDDATTKERAAQPSATEALSRTEDLPPLPKRRQDAMSVELSMILASLPAPHTPARVMQALKSRERKIGSCVVSTTADGVKWERGNGNEEELTTAALGDRLRRQNPR
jgi:hypothetical protein